MLPIARLIDLMLVVNMLSRSTGMLLHCRCVRTITGLCSRGLRLNYGGSRVHRVARLGIVLRNTLLLLLLWLLRLLLLLSRLLWLT